MEQSKLQSGRVVYFDYLRVAATVAVMVMHAMSDRWYSADISSSSWMTMTFYECLVRWPVAIFIMLSGALFLRADHSIRTLYTKYILRILTAFAFWSALYAAKGFVTGGTDLTGAFVEFLYGHYHMWFLYFICGMYVIVPFLRKIVESERLTRYLLVMSLIFGSIIPRIADLAALVSPFWGEVAATLLSKIKIYFLMGHLFYFVLGYYVYKTDISPKWRRRIYLGGVVGLVCTVVPTFALSWWKGTAVQLFLNEASVHVALIALAIFVFAKYHLTQEKFPSLLRKLSKYSFGAFLVHALVIEALARFFDLDVMTFHPVAAVPVVSVLVAVISFGISALIHKIPVLNKYIV